MALSADRVTQRKVPGLKSFPVKDATIIYAGGMVAIQNDGHAIPAADAANLKVVGVAKKTVDNSAGADGDLWVEVEQGLFLFTASSITQAMVGKMMYVVDDETFDDAVGTNGVKAGKLVEYVSTTKGWIRITDEQGVGCVVADADATYGQPEADLINNLKLLLNTWL